MTLTNREIALFARDAVRQEIRTERDRATVANWATCQYGPAQQDMRESGFRITKRVRDVLWSELERISREGL